MGKCIGNGLDFNDARQREIMNEKLMAEHQFYFRDKLLEDSSGEAYVLNACAKEKSLLDAADISDYSHVFFLLRTENMCYDEHLMRDEG